MPEGVARAIDGENLTHLTSQTLHLCNESKTMNSQACLRMNLTWSVQVLCSLLPQLVHFLVQYKTIGHPPLTTQTQTHHFWEWRKVQSMSGARQSDSLTSPRLRESKSLRGETWDMRSASRFDLRGPLPAWPQTVRSAWSDSSESDQVAQVSALNGQSVQWVKNSCKVLCLR